MRAEGNGNDTRLSLFRYFGIVFYDGDYYFTGRVCVFFFSFFLFFSLSLSLGLLRLRPRSWSPYYSNDCRDSVRDRWGWERERPQRRRKGSCSVKEKKKKEKKTNKKIHLDVSPGAAAAKWWDLPRGTAAMDPMIFYFFHRENEEVRSKTKLEGNRKCVVPFFLRFLIGWGGGPFPNLTGIQPLAPHLKVLVFKWWSYLRLLMGFNGFGWEFFFTGSRSVVGGFCKLDWIFSRFFLGFIAFLLGRNESF